MNKYIKAALLQIIGERKYFKVKNFFGGNRIKVNSTSSVELKKTLLRGCNFEISGNNCKVEIDNDTCLINCKIQIMGDDCHVKIGTNNLCQNVWLWIEDRGSKIVIGNDNKFTGTIQLASIEGCKIEIGNDNLFSRDIQISNGDSHSLLDNASGIRINPSQDIVIGDHNWIGMGTTICKGVTIPKNVVVGRGAIVTRAISQSGVAVAGIPAEVVKEGISWTFERVRL